VHLIGLIAAGIAFLARIALQMIQAAQNIKVSKISFQVVFSRKVVALCIRADYRFLYPYDYSAR
jgi:hypothetical protein